MKTKMDVIREGFGVFGLGADAGVIRDYVAKHGFTVSRSDVYNAKSKLKRRGKLPEKVPSESRDGVRADVVARTEHVGVVWEVAEIVGGFDRIIELANAGKRLFDGKRRSPIRDSIRLAIEQACKLTESVG